VFERTQSINTVLVQRCDFWQATRPHHSSSVTTRDVCTFCQWSNGSSNWLFWSSRRYVAKPLRTSGMIAISSLTSDAVVCARPTQTLSLFRKLTLGSETGVFRRRDWKYGTVFPRHFVNRTLNLCSLNDF